MELMLKISDLSGGRKTLDCSAMKLQRGGDICRSMEAHGNVLGVSEPSSSVLQRQTSTVSSRANFTVVDFAMTETAYDSCRDSLFSRNQTTRLKRGMEKKTDNGSSIGYNK